MRRYFFRTYLSTTPVELLTTSSLNETDNSLGRHFRIVVSAVDGQTAYPLPTFYIPSETHLCHSADAFYESDPTCVLPLYANDDAPHILAGAINTLSDRMSPIQ